MKNNRLLSFLFILVLAGFICNGCGDGSNKTSFVSKKSLQKGFVSPPDSIQTSVYWYWISDHISEEGVINDLHAMKEVGINRAFIGNIGLEEEAMQGGKVIFGSEEWWRIMHTALKTATELNIEIGIFNSPGWSQSGGPWVKPEEAMRYLASSRAAVTGGKTVDILLEKPAGEFMDFKVIAYPEWKEEKKGGFRVVSSTPVDGPERLVDNDIHTDVWLRGNEDGTVVLDLIADAPRTIRSLRLFTTSHGIHTPVRLEIKENNEYKVVREWVADRHNGALNVGFDPFAPVVIAFPPVSATTFRLTFTNVHHPVGIREIELSATPVIERYPEKTLAKMFQSPLPYWHEYQWEDQWLTSDPLLTVAREQVIDLTANLSGDRLVWDAPEGDWIILRMGSMPTGVTNAPASPQATGYEIDKMSKKHVESHFEAYMGEFIRRIPAKDRKSWKVVVQDSYETGGQNFTDDLLESFESRYGYDPFPFLPVLYGTVVKNEDVSNRFLWDLRRLVADRVSYDYVGGLREVAHKYGLTTWLENYGHWGFPGEFLQYGGQSDEIGGEFWGEGELGDIENRAASSCAHIYGKNKVSAESFTSAGREYQRYPALLKQRGDRFFSEGINNSLLHVYVHQPYEERRPGMNAWFGTEFHRFNSWFSQLDLFTGYLKRVNFMLQQGLNVADVAYFIGEDAPKMTGVADPALPEGYQFDYINAEVILNDLYVKDGLFTLPHGTQYRILVLPKLKTMRPELVQKIKTLIEEGGIVMGPALERSPSLEYYPVADRIVQEVASSLWGKMDREKKYANIGKGLLINGLTMEDALALAGCVPDFSKNTPAPVLFGHRTGSERDIYFVTNQSGETIEFAPEFRVKDRLPEVWEPVSGKMRMLEAYTFTETGTVVPMCLEPLESVFIVFNDKTDKEGVEDIRYNYPDRLPVVHLDRNWSVQLDPEKRGPDAPLLLDRLCDLATHTDFAVQHYSGTMVYTNHFELQHTDYNRLFVDLHDVAVMAKVKVNGKYAGGVWTAPYRIDITDLVRKGTNRIEVEVVNTWVNRMIGDMKLPEAEREIWSPVNPWRADSPLERSGLIGPVVIEGY